MGWLGAVDVAQAMARRLIFKDCGVPPSTELRKDSNLPEGDVSIVCMDGFDFIRRVKVLGDMFDTLSRKRSDEMGSFINTCRDLGLPLNASKQLIHGLRASVLGGEIGGLNGRIIHSREKGRKLMLKTLLLLTFGQVSQTHVQHWCGLLCFASGFRRHLFSVLQEVFPFIQNFPEPSGSRFGKGENGLYQFLPTSIMDELMIGAILSPFAAFANLRCEVSSITSCSDASEHGGAAAEANHFSSALCPETCSFADGWKSSLAEESCNIHVHKSKDVLRVCTQCNGENMLLSLGLFAQESAETCSVLLDACKLIVTMTVVFLSGPNAPLTWAHSCEGICIWTPFDNLFDCKADFSQPLEGSF